MDKSNENRQEFRIENEIGQVTCDEIEVKHVQNKKYQKQRVRVSGHIRSRLRSKFSSTTGNARCTCSALQI